MGAKIPVREVHSSQRHLFLCTGPDCCQPDYGMALWEVLKRETRRLPVKAMRTKAACLRVCQGGPWLVVYPDGIWYGNLDESRLLRILQEHLVENRPVWEWVSARTGSQT